tara:strand:- start:1329 stop:1724 length:396 start_codon:yes stop_codon:yes gene_type:complete
MITKEKLLFAVCVALALFTLTGLTLPSAESPPEIPNPEAARAYRAVTAVPKLSPDDELELERDPFATKDPWQPAAPAALPAPPSGSWPRALPGGPSADPWGPADRLLVKEAPRPVDLPKPSPNSGSDEGGK